MRCVFNYVIDIIAVHAHAHHYSRSCNTDKSGSVLTVLSDIICSQPVPWRIDLQNLLVTVYVEINTPLTRAMTQSLDTKKSLTLLLMKDRPCDRHYQRVGRLSM